MAHTGIKEPNSLILWCRESGQFDLVLLFTRSTSHSSHTELAYGIPFCSRKIPVPQGRKEGRKGRKMTDRKGEATRAWELVGPPKLEPSFLLAFHLFTPLQNRLCTFVLKVGSWKKNNLLTTQKGKH